jgi:hypothetical protein
MRNLPRPTTGRFYAGNLAPFLDGAQAVRRRVRRSLGKVGSPLAEEDPHAPHVGRRSLNTRVNEFWHPISRRAGLRILQDIYPRGFL